MNILFVCTGNTCRSPMAEGILRQLAEQQGLSVTVSSAGFSAEGSPASSEAEAVMQEWNIDISRHRSRILNVALVEKADLILTMTSSHKQLADALFPQYRDKVHTLGEWSGTDLEISDPFGGDLSVYRCCRDEIADAVRKGCERNL